MHFQCSLLQWPSIMALKRGILWPNSFVLWRDDQFSSVTWTSTIGLGACRLLAAFSNVTLQLTITGQLLCQVHVGSGSWNCYYMVSLNFYTFTALPCFYDETRITQTCSELSVEKRAQLSWSKRFLPNFFGIVLAFIFLGANKPQILNCFPK